MGRMANKLGKGAISHPVYEGGIHLHVELVGVGAALQESFHLRDLALPRRVVQLVCDSWVRSITINLM